MTGGRYPVLTCGLLDLPDDAADAGSASAPSVGPLARRPRRLQLARHDASGFLGGMCLAGACGLWDSGLGSGLDPAHVVMCGVRDVDAGERVLLDTRGVGLVESPAQLADLLDGRPVFVHLDLDVSTRAWCPRCSRPRAG